MIIGCEISSLVAAALFILLCCGGYEKGKAGIDIQETLTGNDLEVEGYFDYDTLLDKIYCNKTKGQQEPYCACTVLFGNNEKQTFDMPMAHSMPQINNCGKGCIETYEWVTGVDGYEAYVQYMYDEKLNNWFQQKETIYEGEETQERFFQEEQWSIDSHILKVVNKSTVLSLYDYFAKWFTAKEFVKIKAAALSVDQSNRNLIADENLRKYNDIAYYLEQSGAYAEAAYLLNKIIDQDPERVVAYINLGDAYWKMDQEEKAKEAYKEYFHLMNQKGKATKIPPYIKDRLKE
ncbi:tetratricopeptide repeat protein [Fulvivirga sediminis]|uniref:Tetratricopeptide repeat protein n=1 Tax=Fulvivirga sediminis TaxID=2803949 RepID=A0A937K2R4_9BACT|nr:tetratricopeptide repeat protein [Fulvivirga sediminis]MBL3658886.1 tetratricopeptide repeat protein [Fulvivirga sediminis]